MQKHLLNWKTVPTKPFARINWPTVSKQIDLNYRGTLLSRILAMEIKTAISLEEAIQLMKKQEESARSAGRKGAEPGHLCWFSYNFVEWISSLGFHIELTGDEFESYTPTDKSA
jgi:hypothetical protein